MASKPDVQGDEQPEQEPWPGFNRFMEEGRQRRRREQERAEQLAGYRRRTAEVSEHVRRALTEFKAAEELADSEVFDLGGLWVLGRLRSESGWRSELGQYDIDVCVYLHGQQSAAPELHVDGRWAKTGAGQELGRELGTATSLPVRFIAVARGGWLTS